MERFLLIGSLLCHIFLIANGEREPWPQGNGTDILAGSCEFEKHIHMSDRLMRTLKRIKPLIGRRYTTIELDKPRGRKPYAYDVGICTQANKDILDNSAPRVDKEGVTYDMAAVLQRNSRRSDQPPNVLGVFNKTEIMSGTDWVMLTYEGGDRHRHKCSNEGRRSVVMITCELGEKKGRLELIEENYNKTEDCYYLFQLKHQSVCPSRQYKPDLGTMLCIALVSLLLIYLVVGCVVQRRARKAGWEERVPNLPFWQCCHGCEVICRCGKRSENGSHRDEQEYEKMSPDETESADSSSLCKEKK